MKKFTLLICFLILNSSVFAQADTRSGSSDNKSIIFLEMKLGAVLGGFESGKFTDAKTAAKGLNNKQSFALYGLETGKIEGEMRVTKPDNQPDEICPDYVTIETDEEAESGVALNSANINWNPALRVPKEIASDNKTYQDIVRKFLQSKKITNPVIKIQKILRVDLEGDGQDEIFIQASNRPQNSLPSIKKGDYSFILLRKIVDGKVKEIILAGDFHQKNIEFDVFNAYEISGILDLDGDGKMEVITHGSYYEGAWSNAYKINNGKAEKILETGCGV